MSCEVDFMELVNIYRYELLEDGTIKESVFQAEEKPKSYVFVGQDVAPKKVFKDTIGRITNQYEPVVYLVESNREKAKNVFLNCFYFRKGLLSNSMADIQKKMDRLDAQIRRLEDE